MKRGLTAQQAGFVWAFIHFTVETACFWWLYARVMGGDAGWTYALLYDALAFVPQCFIGVLADRYPRLKQAPVGAVLILLALVFPWNAPALLLLTLGNCILHVSGAEATLHGAGGRMGPSGIFVGGGSFGVITGRLLARIPASQVVLIPAALMVFSLLLTLRLRYVARQDEPVEGFHAASDISLGMLVLLVFLTVAARAYVGYAIPTGWNKTVWQTVLLFCCMGIGKGAGGILADRFGARRTGVGSLLLALPLLCFGDSVMAVSLLGVLLFSMTMAISLGILVSRMPEQPGFCFGITTVGLFVGTAPVFFWRLSGLGANIAVVAVLTVIAACGFLLCTSDAVAVNRKEQYK